MHLQRSNKWDAPKDVLVVGKQVEHLATSERAHRKYKKRNTSYWDSGIKETCAKRVRISGPVEVSQRDNLCDDVTSQSSEEIKVKLRELGVKTRLQCLK